MPDKLLTLTHIGRIIGEQIYVGDRWWTIREVSTSMFSTHYSIFFKDNVLNALELRREIVKIGEGESHVVLRGFTGRGLTFTSVITLKEMGDMVTFLDALSDRLNDYSDKWNN